VKAAVGVDDGMEDGIGVAVGVIVRGGAVFVIGLRAQICKGAGVCARWGAQVEFSSWGVQVCAFKLGCSGRGVL
jgi:hypothetical protein